MSGVLKEAMSFSFLVMRKRPRRRHVRLNGGAIDRRRIARLDELLGLARQRDDVVSDDADADVVKVVVREDRDVPLGIR